jgi:hypothetical protein
MAGSEPGLGLHANNYREGASHPGFIGAACEPSGEYRLGSRWAINATGQHGVVGLKSFLVKVIVPNEVCGLNTVSHRRLAL